MKQRNKLLFLIVGVFLVGTMLITAFSKRISGKVIDASTGAPIAEAIVLAQWTVTHGIGDHSHTVSKITEVLTDQSGNLFIWGPINPCTDSPEVIIYKKGYVAWRNDYIFPGYVHHLPEFSTLSNYVFKLAAFKQEYSIADHSMFMGTGIIGADFYKTPHYSKAEQDESIRSRPELDKRREEGLKNELIKSLESIVFAKTKHDIRQLCPSLQWVPYGPEIQRLRQEAKKTNSRLYNAMKKNNVVMKIEGDKTYFVRTHWD